MSAFERYAPYIQEYIYRQGWDDLKLVQQEACSAILDSEKHVIIASGTASGKTEAAFFPILTALAEKPSKSIAVLYIGPLKALINDQFERLTELFDEGGVALHAWHGDIGQGAKAEVLSSAQGILQITPESLEALMMTRPQEAARLFSDLRFVVVDEIHALMGSDRGLQVLCLLTRLSRLAGSKARRIGLSATLSDYRPAMEFLAAGTKGEVVAVGLGTESRSLSLGVKAFILGPKPVDTMLAMEKYKEFLYEQCADKKCLIFTNSRARAEQVIADLKLIARERGEGDVFHVHHGSVSAALRRETEAALRETDGPTVAAATLTLELGIDIGDLDLIVQLGAPFSCASFVQRLGRSGRRTGKSRMLFVSLYLEDERTGVEAIPWELLRVIAIVQLYLEERWVEPFALKAKPFSLLVHQSLSVLNSAAELTPAELAKEVLTLPPFRETITQEEYREILNHLLEEDVLERLADGHLILGLAGAELVGHYSFYAVFKDDQAYRVLTREGEVGTLESAPEVGVYFVLAGRSWSVSWVDEERRVIFAEEVENTQIPSWGGSGGQVHTKIIRKMKEILTAEEDYAYLTKEARLLLNKARQRARESGLLDGGIIPTGDKSFILCPWVGTKALKTIRALLENGLRDELRIHTVTGAQNYLQVLSALPWEAVAEKLKRLTVDEDDPLLVIDPEKLPKSDKFDGLIPEELLMKAYLYNEMDVPGALATLKHFDDLAREHEEETDEDNFG